MKNNNKNQISDPINHAKVVAGIIIEKKLDLIKILNEVESSIVAEDEINRVVDLLLSLNENDIYLNSDLKVSSIAAFLPLNLPLYSLFLFGIIPSYQSKNVFLRAPKLLHNTIDKLCELIKIKDIYPSILVKSIDRDCFVREYCADADVIIFTGKYNNFIKIKGSLSENKLFIYNGVGHNPVVITQDADLSMAADKIAFLKTFNNGQDCAGADMVLVHKDVADQFTNYLKKSLNNISVGKSYYDGCVVGPLIEPSSTGSAVDIIERIKNNHGFIEYGGFFDFKNNIVYPTICRCHIKSFRNYKELYSPIIIVSEYDNDKDLAEYFDDKEKRYEQEQMYLSLFGSSDYISKNVLGTIVLQDLIVHEAERGTEEYGGYSHGASLICINGLTICKPLLIPREIYNFKLNPYKKYSNFTINNNKSKIETIQELISTDFYSNVTRIFGSNLKFAFIFGGVARGKTKNYSDIDTFICIKDRNEKQIAEYINWIFSVSEIFGKIPDFVYPAEIMTYKELETSMLNFSQIKLSSIRNSSYVYDSMVWAHALSHEKIATVLPENIPKEWIDIFKENSKRLLKDSSLEYTSNVIDVNNSELVFKNLITKKDILSFLKEMPFDSEYKYTEYVVASLFKRNFFGRKSFIVKNKISQPNKNFRFGPA